jgi:hypothetical protein
MSKFKVGDRVKVVGNNFKPHHHLTIGTEAEILKLTGVDDVWVKGQGSYGAIRQYINTRDIELVPHPAKQKIVVTTYGKITTACLFDGKKLVKSAIAKCSPQDEFVFETGAAIALDRLLGREQKTEAPKFPSDKLVTGVFGRLSDGDWFVVAGESMVYESGSWDRVSDFIDDGENIHGHIECLVKAASFRSAKSMARDRRCLWVRDGVKFE